MKVLWLKTVELLRRYPVLWLPVVWAGALGCGWALLREVIRDEVLAHLLQERSVLGAVVRVQRPTSMGEFDLLAGINAIALTTAEVCCYVAALLMTAKMLGRLTTPDGEIAPYADISIRTRGARVLGTGFVTCIFGLACGVLVELGVVHVIGVWRMTPLMLRAITFAARLVIYAFIAYFVTPAALRLLSRWPKKALDPEVLETARVCSMIAGACITCVAELLGMVPKLPYTGIAGRELLAVIWSMLFALPCAPWFVALSLLGVKSDQDASEVAVS